MFPRFELTSTLRPVRLIAEGAPRHSAAPEGRSEGVLQHGFPAPYAAVELQLSESLSDGVLSGWFRVGKVMLAGCYDTARRRMSIRVETEDRQIHERSRRHQKLPATPERLGVSITGRRLAVHGYVDGAWVTAGVWDTSEVLDLHREEVLGDLEAGWSWSPVVPGDPAPLTQASSGLFGQFGLRDPHVTTYADGEPYLTEDGCLLLTATSAGPGFFDTAHCSTWAFDPRTDELTPRGHLFFRRPAAQDPSGERKVFGDHATHLVRDGERWLVASSSWGDFALDAVHLTRAYVDVDPTEGVHVLDLDFWRVPTSASEIPGVWDPHLVRVDDHWVVTYVEAERFFSFRPVIASGPGLDALGVRGVAGQRTATEGSVLVTDLSGTPRVLASDGRDNPRGFRAAYPVFDLELNDLGTLDAPYFSNIGWPMVTRTPSGWVMITFDGDTHGGTLPGYGTHGNLRILHGRSD